MKNNLIIRDNWDEFCDEIIKSFNKRDKKPPKKFYDYHGWSNIVRKMEKIINQN